MTKKQLETEAWVDEYILTNGYPPTYQEIETQFSINASTAHYRCRNFREKMNQSPRNKKAINLKKITIIELRIAFEKRFIAKTMTSEQMQGAESVWQWIYEICGGL